MLPEVTPSLFGMFSGWAPNRCFPVSPMLPIYLMYLSGRAGKMLIERLTATRRFCLGFSLVFALLGGSSCVRQPAV